MAAAFAGLHFGRADARASADIPREIIKKSRAWFPNQKHGIVEDVSP